MGAGDNKRSVIVGIFVFLAIVILVAGIFILGGKQKRFGDSIEVTALFDDVTGLKKGNNVIFSGVKVGVVKSIAISGEKQVAVSFSIEESAVPYIHKNAFAKIGSESIIGNRTIVVYGGSEASPAIETGDILKTEAQLSTEQMMKTLQESNQNLLAITNDVKGLSANLAKGEGMAGALLTDEKLANNFRTIVANLERTTASSSRAAQALTQFSNKLNTEGGLADELLTDTTVYNRLKSTMAQLQQTMTTASAITGKLNATTDKLNSPNNALGVLLNDEDFALDLQLTMQNLEAGTDKLDANMESLQHSILLNGFFRRKAKREAKQKEREQQKQERLQKLEEKRSQKKQQNQNKSAAQPAQTPIK
ncbi:MULTISPECIES: MlaD family protein [Rufibacter]|uniref:Phospholipid/cholesterol/gamma-HCH transport system substrate-binding protein n=1 Tax=Rufibacter quisquiliarum TaxID=1549639 RepID=A0A839GP48_9BACT|nr:MULTISPECIES: MlaD family protein [Rufibacter]MBA9075621.1 phospholipid/cholesterol/gamma-HCH transport system substrate-binding protein [Rufibacter quisquiliarum]